MRFAAARFGSVRFGSGANPPQPLQPLSWRGGAGLEGAGGAGGLEGLEGFGGAGGLEGLEGLRPWLEIRFHGGSCLSRFRRFTVHTVLSRVRFLAVRFRFAVRFAAFLYIYIYISRAGIFFHETGDCSRVLVDLRQHAHRSLVFVDLRCL